MKWLMTDQFKVAGTSLVQISIINGLWISTNDWVINPSYAHYILQIRIILQFFVTIKEYSHHISLRVWNKISKQHGGFMLKLCVLNFLKKNVWPVRSEKWVALLPRSNMLLPREKQNENFIWPFYPSNIFCLFFYFHVLSSLLYIGYTCIRALVILSVKLFSSVFF